MRDVSRFIVMVLASWVLVHAGGLHAAQVANSSNTPDPSSSPGVASPPISPIRPGDSYRIAAKNTVRGYVFRPDPKTGKPTKDQTLIEGMAKISYRERAIAADKAGKIDRVARVYDSIDFRRMVDGEEQFGDIREEVRRVVLHRKGNKEIPYSTDGPMRWPEIDFIRTHAFVPSLEGFLPEKLPAQGATWKAAALAVGELTGLDPILEGELTCTYLGRFEHQGREYNRIGFVGTVTGIAQEGKTRNTVRGAAYLDPATGQLASLAATGELEILVGNEVVGRLDAEYQTIVERIATPERLSDTYIAELSPTPAEALTQLLHENPVLGVRLLHPRRWFLSETAGNQLMLEHLTNNLVIHLEPAGKVPSLGTFRSEVQKYLEKEQIEILSASEPKESRSTSGRIGRFRIEARIQDRPMTLEYVVVERGGRGATLAGRFEENAKELLGDVDKIARQLEFTPILRNGTVPAPAPGPSPIPAPVPAPAKGDGKASKKGED